MKFAIQKSLTEEPGNTFGDSVFGVSMIERYLRQSRNAGRPQVGTSHTVRHQQSVFGPTGAAIQLCPTYVTGLWWVRHLSDSTVDYSGRSVKCPSDVGMQTKCRWGKSPRLLQQRSDLARLTSGQATHGPECPFSADNDNDNPGPTICLVALSEHATTPQMKTSIRSALPNLSFL